MRLDRRLVCLAMSRYRDIEAQLKPRLPLLASAASRGVGGLHHAYAGKSSRLRFLSPPRCRHIGRLSDISCLAIKGWVDT